ncbi:endonuclease/exonuclease/phosphatase family protein [Pseudomonas salmasensis]|uniref:endonuclease/exonuclease/phosphatase family protein n=1 Tax=Pseudomonas salmasensis TaxID=2745514 RepID=UPI0016472304|nr:endonuclease/exonuclease/phosphatase family protein [Pseudomonas salmasensis]QXH77458.1 endonuclease/exonuclease/phosphatase family protein [Pseudomonas salmasensis]
MITVDNDLEAYKKITIAWWNTSLSPSGNSRGCEDLTRSAAEVIAYLIINSNVDFMALGEISDEDFENLRSLEVFSEFDFHTGVSKAGRSKFDTCYISNPEKITINGLENITSARGNSIMKIAQRIDFSDNKTGTPFHIFVSHWPSRLWCEENHADRHVLGIRLRDEVDKLLNSNTTPPHIILLGDYNDEPFDKSLSSQVMATRDIDLVKKREHLFYNPYWSQMGKGKNGQSLMGGSYYYQSGETTRWHTFDQIIYSHAFVSAKIWRLAECNDHISDVPGLMDLVISRKSKFDHIPVYGTIEKVG